MRQSPYTQITQRHQQQRQGAAQAGPTGEPTQPQRPSGWAGGEGVSFDDAVNSLQASLANTVGSALEGLRAAGVPASVAHEIVESAYQR